jgi:hypothetical protein
MIRLISEVQVRHTKNHRNIIKNNLYSISLKRFFYPRCMWVKDSHNILQVGVLLMARLRTNEPSKAIFELGALFAKR